MSKNRQITIYGKSGLKINPGGKGSIKQTPIEDAAKKFGMIAADLFLEADSNYIAFQIIKQEIVPGTGLKITILVVTE